MSQQAIIAGRRQPLASWLVSAVSELGWEVAETVLTDRPEDGQYFLPPGTLKRVELALERTDGSMLVVDGQCHVGQLADLNERLPETEIHDHRSVVWAWFQESNPVAETRLALWRARLERRLAERVGDQHRSPDGTSGRVADLERQCDRLDEQLAEQQQAKRNRITSSHADADVYVVIADEIGANPQIYRVGTNPEVYGVGTNPEVYDAGKHPRVDGELGTEAPSASALTHVETTDTTIGTHEVAVTTVPPIPWEGEFPAWFEAVVPGTKPALERADFVCSSTAAIATHLATRFDAESVIIGPNDDGNTLEETLADRLTTVTLEVSLPYTDKAHAVVSWLHDRTEVTSISYEGRITLSMVAPENAVDAIEKRVRDVEGCLEWVSVSDNGGP